MVLGYAVDTDVARVDRDLLWKFLSQAYWGRWRTRSDVEQQLDQAWRVVGCYHATDGMVGFCRALSDGLGTAYLADVFVLENHRGRGLSSLMLAEMIDNGPGSGFRWMLHTADAHGLYAKFGFGLPDETYLERPRRS